MTTPRAEPPIGTPASWRLAAAALLLGGVAAGAALAASPQAVWLSVAVTVAAVSLAVPLAWAGRRPPITPGVASLSPRPTASVLIAARDEAAVIGRLIADLARQDHRAADGTPQFEIIVVDDRSVDGTGAAAQAAAAGAGVSDHLRVIRRDGDDLPDGKGAALTAAQPESCRGEVVVVLDGDARIGPAFLRNLLGYISAGAVAVTARRRTIGANASWLSAAQAVELAEDGVLQRGRWASGGCSEFRGNGITVRRNALAAVGGWRADELTEDLGLSSRLAAQLGVTVAWAIDAVVHEEPAHTWRSLWRQRQRWAEGSLRRLLEHGRSVLRSPLLSIRARLDFLAYAGQLLAAPLIAGAIVAAVVVGRPAASVVLIAGYLAAGALLAWVGLGREAAVDGLTLSAVNRARGAFRGALFTFIWLIVIPAALLTLAVRRGALRYAKMAHGEAAAAVAERG